VFELEEENVPSVKFLLFASNVPLVNVTVLDEPTVRLSASCQVPPTPLKVNGKSRVTALVVIVLVPEMAPKVITLDPAVRVIPEATVKLPLTVIVLFA